MSELRSFGISAELLTKAKGVGSPVIEGALASLRSAFRDKAPAKNILNIKISLCTRSARSIINSDGPPSTWKNYGNDACHWKLPSDCGISFHGFGSPRVCNKHAKGFQLTNCADLVICEHKRGSVSWVSCLD